MRRHRSFHHLIDDFDTSTILVRNSKSDWIRSNAESVWCHHVVPSCMAPQAQQDRLRHTLQALVHEPDNQRCADCSMLAPRWANVHLGVFLCKDCAAAHRHLGAPLSQVRSIAFDLWTSAHVQHMRAVGNAKSNAHFLPVPQLYPAPVESDKGSYEWIKYVRDKYVHRAFQAQGLASQASQRTHRLPEPQAFVPAPAPPVSATERPSTVPGSPDLASRMPLVPLWPAPCPAPSLIPPGPAAPAVGPYDSEHMPPAPIVPQSRNPFYRPILRAHDNASALRRVCNE